MVGPSKCPGEICMETLPKEKKRDFACTFTVAILLKRLQIDLRNDLKFYSNLKDLLIYI
jgi:hypothetical protein